jgi:hypothetical protein
VLEKEVVGEGIKKSQREIVQKKQGNRIVGWVIDSRAVIHYQRSE